LLQDYKIAYCIISVAIKVIKCN